MILHLFTHDKFAYDYICFIHEHFEEKDHLFLLFTEPNTLYPIPEFKNVKVISHVARSSILRRFLRIKNALLLKRSAQKADKIILHGLFIKKIMWFLEKRSHLLDKTYWVVWGGDLYLYQEITQNHPLEVLRQKIIPKMAGFITYVKGDFNLIQEWYGAKGRWLECLCYPSNVINIPNETLTPKDSRKRILVGNSADPTNNHIDIFNALKGIDLSDVEVIVPLSYGDEEYAKEIIKEGHKRFDHFLPIQNFLQKKDYLKLLDSISVAFFAHDRQQGMGNLIYLIYRGKKVYLKKTTTSWTYFESIGVVCSEYDDNINLSSLETCIAEKNHKSIKRHHSRENLAKQWMNVFDC